MKSETATNSALDHEGALRINITTPLGMREEVQRK